MKLDILFDVVTHRHNARNSDVVEPYKYQDKGKTIELDDKRQVSFIRKSIQAFMQGVGYALSDKRAIQAFTGSSDLPALTKDVFNGTADTPNFDLFWQEAFKGVSLMKGQLSWEIATVSGALAFKEIPEGGKIEYQSFTGEKALSNTEWGWV